MTRRARRFAGFAGAALVGLVIGLGGVACFVAPALIYPAPTYHRPPQIHDGKLLHIPVAGSSETVALWVPAPEGACTVVHFHGNGEQIADVGWFAMSFERGGVGLLAVEYPGYGLAPGSPSEPAIYRAAESALGYLRDTLHVPRERTVLEGWSLGTGTAAELAVRGEGSRLVLIAPFTSMTDMAGIMVPFLPVSWLVRDRFDTVSKAPHVSVPTFIVHGEADPIIPVAMGERLGALFPFGTTLIIPNAGHNVAQSNVVMEKIVAFARDCPGAAVHPPIAPPPE